MRVLDGRVRQESAPESSSRSQSRYSGRRRRHECPLFITHKGLVVCRHVSMFCAHTRSQRGPPVNDRIPGAGLRSGARSLLRSHSSQLSRAEGRRRARWNASRCDFVKPARSCRVLRPSSSTCGLAHAFCPLHSRLCLFPALTDLPSDGHVENAGGHVLVHGLASEVQVRILFS